MKLFARRGVLISKGNTMERSAFNYLSFYILSCCRS